jgi:hypothetical protein
LTLLSWVLLQQMSVCLFVHTILWCCCVPSNCFYFQATCSNDWVMQLIHGCYVYLAVILSSTTAQVSSPSVQWCTKWEPLAAEQSKCWSAVPHVKNRV